MLSPNEGTPRGHGPGPRVRRLAGWVGLVAIGLATSTGCQVEYAGMTLPSGKYMYDDVQYFPPGPSFPLANTLAATQRARMQAMGLDPGSSLPLPGPIGPPPPAAGFLAPAQNTPGRPTNVNTLEDEALPPGAVDNQGAGELAPPPAPGQVVPPPGVPGEGGMFMPR